MDFIHHEWLATKACPIISEAHIGFAVKYVRCTLFGSVAVRVLGMCVSVRGTGYATDKRSENGA